MRPVSRILALLLPGVALAGLPAVVGVRGGTDRTPPPAAAARKDAEAPPLRLETASAAVEADPALLLRAAGPDAPAPGALRVRRREAFKERNGIYGYAGENYRATLERGWVEVSAGPEFDGLGRGLLALRLETVTAGEETIARGGPAAPVADSAARQVAYERGAVQERYLLRPDALEQDFVVRELPPGRGALVVTCAVSTNLQPPPPGPARQLAFTHGGREAIRLSQAVAVDAAGRRLDLDMAVADGRLTITVPAGWVADASLPIVVDPVIGSPVRVDANISHGAYNPDWQIGADSLEGTFLAVWYEPFGAGDGDIYGQRVSLDGELVGYPIPLATGGATYYPTVSYAPDVNRWLVAWSHEAAFGPYDYGGPNDAQIRGVILNGNGTVHRSDFLIADRPYADQNAFAVYGGGKWHVSYRAREVSTFTSPPATIRGVFVSSDGASLAPADVMTAADPNVYVWASGGYSNGTFAFAWVRYDLGRIEARTLSPTGVLGPVVLVATPAAAGGTLGTPVIYGGANGFLIGWTESHNASYYRLASTSLAFTTLPKTAHYRPYARGTWCAATGEWFLAAATGSVTGVRIRPTGTEILTETIAVHPEGTAQHPVAAWSPARNMVGLFYDVFVNATQKNDLFFARYSLIDPPPAPTGMKAVAGNSQVTVSWNPVAGATTYSLRRTSGTQESLLDLAGTSYADTTVENGQTYTYAVAASNSAGAGPWSASVSATPKAPTSHPVLLVVGNATLGAGDSALRSRLISMGYAVTVKDHVAAATSDASGKRLVLISSTITSGNVGTKFRSVGVPVVVWENALLDDMGMTGAVAGTDFGTQASQTNVAITNAAHPLAGGLSGTSVQVLTAAKALTWGKPAASAAKAASVVGNSARSVVFGYEKGAAMAGLTAPARRVGLFLDDTAAASLNANGWKLVEAAIRWAAGALAGPTYVNVWSGNGTVSLSWAPVEGAASYDILRSTSLNGTYTKVAGGITDTRYVLAGLTNGTTYYFKVVPVNAAGPGAPSPAGSAQPNPKTLVAGIVGPRQFWSLRPGATFDPADNRGEYEVFVRLKEDSKYTPVDPAQVGLTHRLIPRRIAPPSPAVRVTRVANALKYQVDAVTADADVWSHNPYDFEITVTYPNYKAAVVTVPIAVSYRFAPLLRFYFPQPLSGTAGQTERPYPFSTAPPTPPNQFFVGTSETDQQGTRNDARSKFLGDLVYTRTDPRMRQAGLRLYSNMEAKYPLKVKGFDGSGTFVARDATSSLWSPGFQEFVNEAEKNLGRIQVYFVKKIQAGAKMPQGMTRQIVRDGAKMGNVILIGDDREEDTDQVSDAGDLAHVVLAHELGHAFGLDEKEDVDQVYDLLGTLNNLTQVTSDWNHVREEPDHPLQWLIMRRAISGRNPNIQNWFVDLQAMTIFSTAHKHPATRNSGSE